MKKYIENISEPFLTEFLLLSFALMAVGPILSLISGFLNFFLNEKWQQTTISIVFLGLSLFIIGFATIIITLILEKVSYKKLNKTANVVFEITYFTTLIGIILIIIGVTVFLITQAIKKPGFDIILWFGITTAGLSFITLLDSVFLGEIKPGDMKEKNLQKVYFAFMMVSFLGFLIAYLSASYFIYVITFIENQSKTILWLGLALGILGAIGSFIIYVIDSEKY